MVAELGRLAATASFFAPAAVNTALGTLAAAGVGLVDRINATHNPHIALAYGTRDAPNDALAADLLTTPAYRARHRPGRAALDVTEVIVADVDTFALDPWRWRTTQPIRLLRGYPTL